MAVAIWNTAFEASPSGADDPSLGDDKFRELKGAIRERLIHEHTLDLASGALAEDGWHKMGAAVIYVGETAPESKPDAVTALDATYDIGRLWLKVSTGALCYWSGADWTNVFANGLHNGSAVVFNSAGAVTWG